MQKIGWKSHLSLTNLSSGRYEEADSILSFAFISHLPNKQTTTFSSLLSFFLSFWPTRRCYLCVCVLVVAPPSPSSSSLYHQHLRISRHTFSDRLTLLRGPDFFYAHFLSDYQLSLYYLLIYTHQNRNRNFVGSPFILILNRHTIGYHGGC